MNRNCLGRTEVARRRSCILSLKIGVALFALIGSSVVSVGQSEPETPKRLKIGVALEGGGALGLAHIGVLRWFEQHHIPIDYLSGNSMGGLVGGLYATGQSPDQIERTVKGMDWPLLLGGVTPFEDLSFRRKEDAREVQSTLAIGFKKGASLPSGMNAGHQISLLIDRETLAYSDVKSFDDLPIPFRCVATDLVTGKAHVFSTGPLGSGHAIDDVASGNICSRPGGKKLARGWRIGRQPAYGLGTRDGS